MNNSAPVSKNLQNNLQNPTYLGTLVVSYLKALEQNEQNVEKSPLLENLKGSIIKEIQKSNFALEVGFSMSRTIPAMFNNIEIPRITIDQNVFYAMATNSALNFLYDVPQFLSYIKNSSNAAEIFKTIGVQKLKQREYSNTNNAMNAAIMYKNDKFINFFFHLYEETVALEILKESVKVALNSSNKDFLSNFIGKSKIVEDTKTAKGQNCTYFVYNQDMLDFLKEKFNMEPKSLEDWFEKIIFKTIDSDKMMGGWRSLEKTNIGPEMKEEFLSILETASKTGVNVEHYNIKKFAPVCAPPLWLLCAKKPELIERVYPFLKPGVKDSLGSSFLFYIFNTLKKQAPDTKNEHLLNTLEQLITKNEHLMEESNLTGVNLLTLLKSTIDKKTLKPSFKLEAFQRYCEKLAIGYESKKIMSLNQKEKMSEHSLIKKIKI